MQVQRRTHCGGSAGKVEKFIDREEEWNIDALKKEFIKLKDRKSILDHLTGGSVAYTITTSQQIDDLLLTINKEERMKIRSGFSMTSCITIGPSVCHEIVVGRSSTLSCFSWRVSFRTCI